MGVIFGFSSDISIDTLAEHAADLNKKYDSPLWPDLVVVLDQGVIGYAIQWPGQHKMAGDLGTRPAPGDGELALNRFFLSLLAQLAFYNVSPRNSIS